jgi:hypothetical protein
VTRHVDAERLSAWNSGELVARDAAVVRAHIDDCASCAAVAESLRVQVVATRSLALPEPPLTLWPAIAGALEKSERRTSSWLSWRSTLLGALAGAAVVAVTVWGIAWRGGRSAGVGELAAAPGASSPTARIVDDPLLAEAERELGRAAASYEQAVDRLRKILEREQTMWDPETRTRIGERLARLDEAVVHSRDVARRDPSDSSGAEMLFSAYRRQIDFLAEAVHRGTPASGEGFR